MRSISIVFAIALTLGLAACGFHLRGTGPLTPLAFQRIFITSPPGGIGDALRGAIAQRKDVQLAPLLDAADAVLRIEQDVIDKQVLSVNRSGRVSEYELVYRLRFSLTVGGREAILPTQLTLRRDYSFDDTNVLGKDAEEQSLMRDMRNDAAQQILRRIAAVKPAPLAPVVAPTPESTAP